MINKVPVYYNTKYIRYVNVKSSSVWKLTGLFIWIASDIPLTGHRIVNYQIPKFNIMNEFVAICLLIVLPFILAIVINEAGRRTLQRDYDREYAELEKLVKEGPVNEKSYEEIRNFFIRIKKYKCRNKEKLSVLENQFHKDFVIVRRIKDQRESN
jgi:hypothetical protein